MPLIPNIDFNVWSDNQVPPNHRTQKFLIWCRCFIYWWWYKWILFWRLQNGSDDLLYYNPAHTYIMNDLIKDVSGVYESQTNGNTGNPIGDGVNWLKVLDSFIGVNESINYNGRYLYLTYALNRIFGTTFRQPPYPAPYGGSGTFSDIYITNGIDAYTSFVVFSTETLTSDVYTGNTGNTDVFTIETYGSASSYFFVVHIPVAVFTALGATLSIRTSIVNGFISKYVPSGIGWSLATY